MNAEEMNINQRDQKLILIDSLDIKFIMLNVI